MKIMVVNNNVIYENNKELFIYKETGKFFHDLLEFGNEVNIFQFRMKFNENDFLADYNICNKGFNIISIKRRNSKVWAYIRAIIVGVRTIRKSDFIYLFYPGQICIILAIISLICRRKFGFYIRGEKGILSNISKYLYKKAEIVYTISPKFTKIVQEIGANAETIRPMMDVSENDIVFKRKYIKKQNYKFLYVGRIEEAKGVYELLEAIRNIIKKGIVNFKMHLVGDGADALILKDMIKKYQLSEYIVLHGTITNRDKLGLLYKEADLFILPTHHEGFPRVLYEAMIFGVPIATTFVGSISFLMKDKTNCFKIEPKNAESIELIIKHFINDYENSAIVAKNATETIINYLSDKKEKHAKRLNEHLKMVNTNK